MSWPTDAAGLLEHQRRLADARPEPWRPGPPEEVRVGGCWASFERGVSGPGAAGDLAWSAAVVLRGGRVLAQRAAPAAATAGYVPGMLALRIGPLLERVVRLLPDPPDVLLVDGTGRDHPRRAGLALHLGAELDVPTVGVTHRPLLARGEWPADERGGASPLVLDGEVVAAWVRTRAGTRPLVAHPGWRTDVEAAVAVVRRTTSHRTPEPLRVARRLAREQRALDSSR